MDFINGDDAAGDRGEQRERAPQSEVQRAQFLGGGRNAG